MGFKIPFTKAWFSDIYEKSHTYNDPENFITTSNFLGFDGIWGNSDTQKEQRLIDKGYGSNVTAYAIIKKIANAGAEIPKKLIDLNNPEEEIIEGELYEVLKHPGIHQGETLTQFSYFETLLTYLLGSGNIYQHGLKSVGFGDIWQQMEILPSGLVVPTSGTSYRLSPTSFVFSDKQNQIKFQPEEILQTKYINPTSFGLESLEGLSPLQAALLSLEGSTDIQKSISVMVKNQGVRGVLSNDSNRLMDPEQAKTLSNKANEKLRGVKNFNKIHVSNTKMAYTQMGMNATDLRVIESGVLTDRQLCNAYSTPSVLFNDPANSTYNNYTTALKTFYTDAVLPATNKILQDTNENWLKQWSLRDNKRYSWQLDTSSIEALQADQKAEAEKDKIEMEGVNIVLNMNTTSEAKKILLIDRYGYSEELATALSISNGEPNE